MGLVIGVTVGVYASFIFIMALKIQFFIAVQKQNKSTMFVWSYLLLQMLSYPHESPSSLVPETSLKKFPTVFVNLCASSIIVVSCLTGGKVVPYAEIF